MLFRQRPDVGTRFYLYERNGEGWQQHPVGYVNVGLVRTRNVAPLGANGIDTILALTPANLARMMR